LGSEVAAAGLRFSEFIATVFVASRFFASVDWEGTPWRDLAATVCSALSTDANRSLISVPVYKSNSPGFDGRCGQAHHA
jgi:hypothetical protein